MPAPTEAPPGAPRGAGPLAGVTVLDLSSVGPASRCTRLLADYGATVVKVGPVPGRGPAQTAPPFFAYSAHRGMRRVQLDVRHPDGRTAFLALAATADVVVESFRPGVVDRLGIGYEAVRDANPAIVYCSTSGYGQDGPRAGWAGHDLDYLAVGGFLASSGPRADGAPPVPGATIADGAAGGMHAALAVCAALVARARTGEGTRLDVSVADGVLWLMSLAADEALATGSRPGPGHDVLTGRYACYDTYRAGDGRFLAVAAIEAKFFANLCTALGCEAWIERQYDDDAQDDIRGALAAAFATAGRDHWVEALAGADTCVAPVQEVAELGDDPQFAWRRAVVSAEHPVRGPFRQVGAVLAGTAPLAEPVTVPDETVTDTDTLLAAAGLSARAVADLRSRRVVA
ncbi:MAG TPA: CaiB/BaiF CoA-transferase family protein [Acidimicrobiales bacterium]|nr:CaiB/BaiF CoA-transferase family protein [Acidimicrobiales bacterium]